jgi:hypothetical protein
MKKLLLIAALFSCVGSINAMQPEQRGKKRKTRVVEITPHLELAVCRNNLSRPLQEFVNDFERWPQKDKEQIGIADSSLVIGGLSKEREAPYGGNLGYWIDCRTHITKQRSLLITCLKLLQQQQQ